MAGPSMVTFTSNGKHGFVVHGKAPVVQKVDADSRQVIASQAMPAPFTPFGLVTPDDQELFVVHKAAGTISVLRTDDLSYVVQGLGVGPRANHVAFVGKLAYVTVGGPAPSAANPDPEGKIVVVDRTTHAIVRQWTGPAWTGDPHGIWATPDGRRLFVGHERGNRVTAIDTGEPDDPADDAVVGPATGSSADLAYVKQPIDVVIKP
jgi:DNA-binding beta-propeller fold protein YncE